MLDHLLELCVFCFTFLSFNVAHVSLFFFPAGFVSARLPPSRERLLERTERRLLPHKGLRSLSHSDRAPLMSLVLIVMNIQRGGGCVNNLYGVGRGDRAQTGSEHVVHLGDLSNKLNISS